ncbi:MAG: hypothetical protein JWM56_383 [Candidatus Peribacteria bacterium]|nr:hypothetical protein [Candidatus Peribacteria bacterium]
MGKSLSPDSAKVLSGELQDYIVFFSDPPPKSHNSEWIVPGEIRETASRNPGNVVLPAGASGFYYWTSIRVKLQIDDGEPVNMVPESSDAQEVHQYNHSDYHFPGGQIINSWNDLPPAVRNQFDPDLDFPIVRSRNGKYYSGFDYGFQVH